MLEGVIEFNSLQMNVESQRTLVSSAYFINVTSVDGLFGSDVRYESYNIPGTDGERSGLVLKGGRSITLTGYVNARGLVALRQGLRALEQAFWDHEKHYLYYQLAGEPRLRIQCRTNQPFASVEEQGSEWPKRAWTVGLRADDPRSYLADSPFTLYPAFMT